MTEKLRIGFIGCGEFATKIIWPCLRYAPIEVAYACSRRIDRAERNSRMFGALRATTNIDDILADDGISAVFVIGPPAIHHLIGKLVLEAGKDLFIEKPPGESLGHAIELREAAEHNGVQCQVGYQKRFALAYRMARDHTLGSEFGVIRLCKVNYSHWRHPNWRSHLTRMSVHPLDLVRFFMGDAREAHLLKRTEPDGGNICVLTLMYDSGSCAIVNMSAIDPNVQEWVELSGENQFASVRNLIEYRRISNVSGSGPSNDIDDSAVAMWNPEFAVPHLPTDSLVLQGYAGEVIEFARAILNRRAVSPSINDGVVTMRYVEAIIKASDGVSKLELDEK